MGCFALRNGKCSILINDDECGRDCPFFKEHRLYLENRLKYFDNESKFLGMSCARANMIRMKLTKKIEELTNE